MLILQTIVGTMPWPSISSTTLVGATALRGVPHEHALIMKECSANYKAAQQAGTLQGLKWKDFCQVAAIN